MSWSLFEQKALTGMVFAIFSIGKNGLLVILKS
jgi:hypothetical protein